jgi:RNA polymerase sigma-70 factor (ECF subfamily)
MVTIWHKAAGFDPARSSVLTWTFVIARNRRIDSLRRERSTTTYGSVPPEAEDDSAGTHEVVQGAQTDALMREAIASLPPDQQEVIRRSFFDDEPHSAIAAALSLPLGTVKSRLRIAFAKLRSRMENLQ